MDKNNNYKKESILSDSYKERNHYNKAVLSLLEERKNELNASSKFATAKEDKFDSHSKYNTKYNIYKDTKREGFFARNKGRIIKGVAGIVATAVIAFGAFSVGKNLLTDKEAYGIYVNGEEVALVEDEATAKNILPEYIADQEKNLDREVAIKDQVVVKKVEKAKNDITKEPQQAKNAVANNVTPLVEAGVIKVNGDAKVALSNEQQAQNVLDKVKNQYELDNKNAELSFKEDVTIDVEQKPASAIKTVDSAIAQLTTIDEEEASSYTIKNGDTIASIANANNITKDSIIAANPGLDARAIKAGQEIKLTSEKAVLSVVTVDKGNKTEAIEPEVKYVENDQLEKGQENVLEEGKAGVKALTTKTVMLNGTEVETSIEDSKIIEEPIAKVIERGTMVASVSDEIKSNNTSAVVDNGQNAKREVAEQVMQAKKAETEKALQAKQAALKISEEQAKKSNANFNINNGDKLVWPTQARRISSPFGRRTRDFHTGMDIDGEMNDDVWAAASGKVTYAGWCGGYGNFVKIDHGNGVVTAYAHLNSINVKVGQSVSVNQNIGKMGSTGNSTGSHLHLEVIINGVQVNPRGYVQ